MIAKLHPIFKVEQLFLHLERDFKVVLQNPTNFTARYASLTEAVPCVSGTGRRSAFSQNCT